MSLQIDFSQETADKLCEMLATGLYTPYEACAVIRLSGERFNRWYNEHPGFCGPLKLAQEQGRHLFSKAARAALLELLQSKQHEEEVCTYAVDEQGNSRLVSRQVTTKTIVPDPAAVIFALKNFDGENFQETHSHFLSLHDARHDQVTANGNLILRGTTGYSNDILPDKK